MYPKKMEMVEIFLMKGDLKKVLEDLQGSRLIHSMRTDRMPEQEIAPELFRSRSRLERIEDLLGPLEEPVKGLKGLLLGGPRKYYIDEGKLLFSLNKWLSGVEKIVKPFEKKLKESNELISDIDELITRLSPLSGLDIDLKTLDSFRRSKVKVGTTKRFDELSNSIMEVGGDIQSSLLDKKEGLHAVRIAYLASSEKKISDTLKGRTFTESNIDVSRVKNILKRASSDQDLINLRIDRLLPRLDLIKEGLQKDREDLLKRGSVLASRILPALRAYMEELEIRLERSSFGWNLKSTRYAKVITGWVEKDRFQEIKDIMECRSLGRHHINRRDPTDEEIEANKVPTKLKNNWLGTMFEPMTKTFAIPRYNEIDPSIFISLPFILFFGLMLGDAGYGIVIMSVTGFLLLKGPKKGSFRMTVWMGFLMGLSTTIAGIWMGAFFGDLVPRLILGTPDSPLYSVDIFGMSLPYNTLKDPMLLFQISLYIGVAQLNIGILLLGIDKLIKKKVWGFLKGTVSWLLVQSGGLIFLGSFLFGWWDLTTPLLVLGASSFFIGTALMAFESKGMVLFDIEGYVGDWISYTRILALGLSTFGLALAFNIIGRMIAETHIIIIPLVIILMTLLHLFNMLLQSLGAAIHSLRLQFVEFFGRFYEGGGVPFEPFGMERNFTKVKGPEKKGRCVGK